MKIILGFIAGVLSATAWLAWIRPLAPPTAPHAPVFEIAYLKAGRCEAKLRHEKAWHAIENDIFPAMSNRDFVRLAYQTVLRREPDEGGWWMYTNGLDNPSINGGPPVTRGWIVWQMMRSEEFADLSTRGAQ
jgi:hypothetical protein